MRSDSIGMFWEDIPRIRVGAARTPVQRTPPPVPNTGWTTPTEFPRLSDAAVISFDTETCDPNLRSKGPGNIRDDGYMVGLSVAVPEGQSWYFPFRHEMGGNMDADMVLRWAKEELGREHQPKIGANLMYDMGWLKAEGVTVKGPLIDVQIAEPLIDENAYSFSLDRIANKYLGEGKVDDALYQWSAAAYGGLPNRKDQIGNLWRCPVQLVGPYAEADADLPMRIWVEQQKIINAEGLKEVFDLESRLLPVLLRMREMGVPIDLQRAEGVRDQLLKSEQLAQKMLDEAAGRPVDIWAAASIAVAFDRQGVEYPLTAKTKKPSFTKEWLAQCQAPIAQAVNAVRRYNKARTTFVEGYIFDNEIKGRIHGSFHPLRSDEGGTVSGRFSSSNPNLQNIPARDPELGPLIRSIYVPDEDCKWWGKRDYSQVEYRLLAHYAMGQGANEVRQKYNDDPNTDYHEMTQELIRVNTDIELGRKETKNINFGLAYGMSDSTLARHLGISLNEAVPLFEAYHAGAPFVKTTFDRASKRAAQRGYLMLLSGRRRRFNSWEAQNYKLSRELGVTQDKVEMVQRVLEAGGRGVKRAHTHKALNSVLQGGSADIIKKAMLEAWDAGIFEVLKVYLTVHDELDYGKPDTPEAHEASEELGRIMVNSYPLKVPLSADEEIGPNWGNVK